MHILRLTVPFHDIYTSLFTVKTDEGILLFDTGTYPVDITDHLLPFWKEAGISSEDVRAVFISHFHGDHAGGLATLLPFLPNATVYSRSKKIYGEHPDRVVAPEDGELLLGTLRTVTIPGHSKDSAGLLDLRTGTLLSGDSLQLHGIFGSGAWGSNITLPLLHLEALEKLRTLPIKEILTAHDYHPLGYRYDTPEKVSEALEHCRASLFRLRDLIRQNPTLTDEKLALLAEENGSFPHFRPSVLAAIRAELV